MASNDDSPDNETSFVRLYLDESGDESPSTPIAVIGGMLINASYFPHFEEAWDKMLDRHGIAAPLHMKEFGRPHGRFARIGDCCRHELFAEVADLINHHKILSIGATISNEQYQKHIPQIVRDRFSVYAMCFLMTVVMNHKLAELSGYAKKVSFILDNGNPKAEHVRQGHAEAIRLQKAGQFLNVGSLVFGDDGDLGCLQAADVIAWGVRRRATNIPFGGSFSPIESILDETTKHAEHKWTDDWLQQLGGNIAERLEREQKNEKK